MSRLIDADMLLDNLDKIRTSCMTVYGNLAGAVSGAMKIIDTSHTVDAVPVVKCRECKYRSKAGCPIIDANIWMDDDDFCSHGERKEGAD